MAQHRDGKRRIIRLMRARHAGQGQSELPLGVAVMQATFINHRIPRLAPVEQLGPHAHRLLGDFGQHRRRIFLTH